MACEEVWVDTAAGGRIAAIWDGVVVNNTYWSVYDASAGTNQKVYRCYDSGENVDFYVNVLDNQTYYSTLELWEGWDTSTHVGTGDSLTILPTNSFRSYVGESAYVIYNDHRVIIASYYGIQACYIGELKRFDTSLCMPILIAKSSASSNWHNPLGLYHSATACLWGALWNHIPTAGVVINPYAQTSSEKFYQTVNGEYLFWETPILDETSQLLMGRLDGVMHCYSHSPTGFNVREGERVQCDGETWMYWNGTYSTKYGSWIRMN